MEYLSSHWIFILSFFFFNVESSVLVDLESFGTGSTDIPSLQANTLKLL